MVLYFKKKKLLISLSIIIILTITLQSNFFWQLLYPIKYKDLIKKHSAENGVDPLLVAAIIKTESKFNPTVESNRGARGLMQIMPDTGLWIAQQMKLTDFDPEQLFDEETNISLGTWYLANLQTQFRNEVIAIAAYNAGRGNVRQWLKTGQWNGQIKSLEDLPFGETKDYVKKVLNFRETYRQIYNGEF